MQKPFKFPPSRRMVGQTEWAVGFFVRPSARKRIVSLSTLFFPSFLPLSPQLSSPLLTISPSHRFSPFFGSNLCPPVCSCPTISRGKKTRGEKEKRFEITVGRKNIVNVRGGAKRRRRGEVKSRRREARKWKDNAEPALFVPLPLLDICQVYERNYKFYPLIHPFHAGNNTKSSYV